MFHVLVINGWSGAVPGRPMLQIVNKITATRLSLLYWQRNTFGRRGREIELLRSRLQEILLLVPSLENQQERSMLSVKLDSLLAEDHAYWKQRSNITWLVDGDRNTKFFHRKASNRGAKNRLLGLYNDIGLWQSTEYGMESVVLSYFRKMFTASDRDLSHMNSLVDLLQPKVIVAMNRELCAGYSAEEIKTTLFQMYPTKFPGPDGMPPLFFQHYWDSIGPDIVKAVQCFLNSGQFIGQVNFTHVCLIPKVKNPERVTDL